MSRFLFVVPPVAPRLRPALAAARELSARGHDVAWTTHHRLLPAGAVVVPPRRATRGDPGDIDAMVAAAAVRATRGRRGPAGWIELWDDLLLPLARTMLPAVHAAVDGFRPDALVVDQHALAGAAVGRLRGLPWATLVPTSAGLADPLADLPAVARQIRRRSRRFLRDAGLDDITAARTDPQSSPHLVVAFTTEALTGPVDDPTGRYAFVGPCPEARPHHVPFAWNRLDRVRPLVVVTLEAPHWHRGAGLYSRAAEALAGMDVQAVIVGPPDLVARTSRRVVVVPRAPLPALIRRAAAVVCDGGDATVAEALSFGVPLVVAPLIADQPIVAGQLVRASAAVRLDARLAPAARIGRALDTVLTDRRIRLGARQVRASFAAAGGSIVAADRLEALVPARTVVRGRSRSRSWSRSERA
ncbi:MAG TPA: nucleotide disphospho-sugar-binding domain-containing protein [Acidimicrobiales bacterium]|nr:nucleotide disphospho-sugar-binding domain-containing protein [Acidimicrobiales bacterium]